MVAPMRVASLLPSATEIVCSVGAGPDLVGVSHECDFPTAVVGLPVLTRPRRALPRQSGAIDRTVREILSDAAAVYELELDRLRELRPQLIVTQDLCDVCAVSLDDVRAALRELAAEDTALVSCKPLCLADVWGDVRRVGAALGRADEGERVALALEQRLNELFRRTSLLPARPAVLTLEWLDPVMVGGTWMPELVAAAGGRALVTETGEHAPTLTRAELATLEPDVVLIKPCGFELERTAAELDLLRSQLPWDSWRAVRAGRVYLADGNAYFNRPGPRLVESAEILAACVHPAACADLAARHAPAFRRVSAELELLPVAGN
jgi:iron complex transport system substrate-binding protein